MEDIGVLAVLLVVATIVMIVGVRTRNAYARRLSRWRVDDYTLSDGSTQVTVCRGKETKRIGPPIQSDAIDFSDQLYEQRSQATEAAISLNSKKYS